jgi:hypothetical protein
MMRWAGHVERVGEMRNSPNILVGEHEGTLEWILGKKVGMCGLDPFGSG